MRQTVDVRRAINSFSRFWFDFVIMLNSFECCAHIQSIWHKININKRIKEKQNWKKNGMYVASGMNKNLCS